MTRKFLSPLALTLALAGACHLAGPVPPEGAPALRPGATEAPPLGRLPADVRPLHYALDLRIVPEQERFEGRVAIDIQLDRPRGTLWLHGKSLDVTRAVAVVAGIEIPARYEQVDEVGVARLRFENPLPAGPARLELVWSARFDESLHGLYRVQEAGRDYAFTQFEALYARRCFPGFDEPAFKTPFDVRLEIEPGQVSIANTEEVSRRELDNGRVRVRFATTEPLPTYLLAFAVGPLDVVEAEPIPANEVRARPLPLRGVAARGKGPRLRYALAHSGAFVQILERYLGIAYPYSKLDIIAVPDFAAGAMENAGAITFREWLLLLDEEALPANQKRAFASVMAHELSHMWFGDLVTMPWWNDLWLNEAFATWLAARTVQSWDPEQQADVGLLERVHEAMQADAQVSARQIRQPITSSHDVHNAFDGITYSKGGGVLAMFEQWLGPETFQRGLHAYLERYRFGNATGDEFLAAMDEASGRDVSGPFRTFLEQPGLPLLAVARDCQGSPQLIVEQSRFLPLGSDGDADRTWRLPACFRYQAGGAPQQQCVVLQEPREIVPLDADRCPAWVLPNAAGAGYFRFSLDDESLRDLTAVGLVELSLREKLALADSVNAGLETGQLRIGRVLTTLAPFASEPDRFLVEAPMHALRLARDRLVAASQRPAVEAWARRTFASAASGVRFADLGDDDDHRLYLERLANFLIRVAHHEAIRAEAARLGRQYVGFGGDGRRHEEVVDPTLAGLALATAAESNDPAFFDALLKHLADSDDANFRGQLLRALARTTGAQGARARALALDASVKTSEIGAILWTQTGRLASRDAAWRWFTEHYDALLERLSEDAGYLPWLGSGFCSEARAREVEAFFAPRIDSLAGGPRNLVGTLETIRLCAAQVDAHAEDAAAFFAAP